MSDIDVLPTGFPTLDRDLGGGFRTGDLLVLGGDSGSGTSSLALAIALNAGAAGCLFLTGEMSPDRVAERALAIESRVQLSDLRSPTLSDVDAANIAAAATRLRYQAPVVRVLQGGGVDAVAAAVGEQAGIALVVVDGLESLLTGAASIDDQLAYSVLALKRIAISSRVAVLLVTHVGHIDGERADRRPRLSDFGVRGAIGVHADVVLGLYREEIYVADLSLKGAAELLILKRREGSLGYVDMFFYEACLRFEDVLET
ncbi:MAG: DnaB helicase C-terminal domain-containing protein [Gemmatimonadota bacterium]|nr:DnaB helicase C-terminal domain-containing protein [Gemmatimonadota bacterium]